MASRSTPILQLIVILLTLMSAVEGSNQCPRTGNKRLKPIYGLTLLPIPIHISGVGTTFTLGVQKMGVVNCFYDFGVKSHKIIY